MDDRPEVDTPVPTQRVQGRTTIARHTPRAASAATTGMPDILDALVPEEFAAFIRANRGTIALTAIVAVLTELLPDAPWLLIIPALVGIAAHRLGQRLTFTFAMGVIGPRPALD